MTRGEKLQRFIDHLGLSKLGFAKSIGVSSTVINGIVNDSNNAGHKVLAAIKRAYPEFNLDWLLNSQGEMLLPVDVKKQDNSYLQDYLEKLEAQFERLLNQLETKDRQIEKLMDLLGKLDLGESMPWELVRELHQRMAAAA